jgi:hypothetical protein
MAERTVVVPNRPDIIRIRFEQELRGTVDAPGGYAAHRARAGVAGLLDWPFDIEEHVAWRAVIFVASHSVASQEPSGRCAHCIRNRGIRVAWIRGSRYDPDDTQYQ